MISIVVILILACALTCFGVRHDLEAEHANIINTTGTGENYREAASGGITVNLLQNDYLKWYLTVTRPCNVEVLAVRYSNDGFSDTIQLVLNGTTIGSFITEAVSHEGELWNVFKSSDTVGNPVSLLADQYTLKLFVRSADEDGVEIDKVTLQLNTSCIPPSVSYSNVPPDENSPTTTTTSADAGTTPADAGTTQADAGTTPSNGQTDLVRILVPIACTIITVVPTTAGVVAGIYYKRNKTKNENRRLLHPAC